MISFKTHDGLHYLCAELDGRVVADRTIVGPWETWTVEFVDGGVTLKSAHGLYLCAELDGSVVANRVAVGPWETWHLVSDAHGVGFQSHHGGFLVAELGGGQGVRADRFYSGPGPWETFQPSMPLSQSSVPLSRLRVEGNKRYFANDAGRFDWREIAAFSLLGRLLKGETDYVRGWLQRRRAEGFTITRTFLTLDGDYWKHFRTAPDMPGYWEALELLVQLHAETGLYMRACYLGALEPFGGIWHPDRRDVYDGNVRRKAEAFVVDAARRLAPHTNVVAELSNEPTQIGMRYAWDNGALVSLGKKVKAAAPLTLLCGSEDNDGRGLIEPFDFADAHLDREHEIAGWQWLKRRLSEHFVIDQQASDPNNPQHDPWLFPPGHLYAMRRIKQMPFVAGENRNMGQDRADGNTTDGPEKQPSVCFGVAALSRARRVGGVCFHWDGGLWTTEPKNETPACIAAWHKGFDVFPMLTDPMWRGQWGLNRGDYWRDVWPGSDDPATVERHIRENRGPWRACGCGAYSVVFPEPKAWDWNRNLDAPAERVAFNDAGTFNCGVYKRT